MGLPWISQLLKYQLSAGDVIFQSYTHLRIYNEMQWIYCWVTYLSPSMSGLIMMVLLAVVDVGRNRFWGKFSSLVIGMGTGMGGSTVTVRLSLRLGGRGGLGDWHSQETVLEETWEAARDQRESQVSWPRQGTSQECFSLYSLFIRKFCIYLYTWVSLVSQTVKNPPAMQQTWVQFPSWEDPLKESMATHSSILVWRIPTDRGAWQATVHGVSKSRTWWQWLSTAHIYIDIDTDIHILAIKLWRLIVGKKKEKTEENKTPHFFHHPTDSRCSFAAFFVHIWLHTVFWTISHVSKS